MQAASSDIFKFKKIVPERPGFGEEFKVIVIKTGRVAYKSISTTVHKGIFDRLRLANLCAAAAISAGAAASKDEPETAEKPKKATKIRAFTAQHKFNIMTEALHGHHTKSDGVSEIEFQNRNKHGNLGPYYASICGVLNDGVSYPSFSKSKAVEGSVRSFVDSAMEERVSALIDKYGADFYGHEKFMDDYDSDSDSDGDMEFASEARYNRKNFELLDFLIHLDKIHEPNPEDFEVQASVHSVEQEDAMLEGKVDALSQKTDGDEEGQSSKKRKHKLEKPREKKSNPAVQLQEQQSSISSMLDKLMAFNADPIATSSLAPADPAIQSIRQSLLQHATPPGTVSVCEKLADSLAGYGFCSFQELIAHPRSDARAILVDLKWSPLQIQKVFGLP
jgi:hypothetical protein